MRPTINQYYIKIAELVATRSTCCRRQVGAVAIDKNNLLIGTGYNGSAKNTPHCVDIPCKGASSSSGNNLDECNAIHAEQNLIAHVRNPQNIHTVYLHTKYSTHR